jgi:hypothetical protein
MAGSGRSHSLATWCMAERCSVGTGPRHGCSPRMVRQSSAGFAVVVPTAIVKAVRLRGSPRAPPKFGPRQHTAALGNNLPLFERHWHRRPRRHGVGGLRQRRSAVAGPARLVRATRPRRRRRGVPHADHGLSEAILPRFKAGEDPSVPYAMLTHAGQDAVRLVAGEIRGRVPAMEHGSRQTSASLLAGGPAVASELSPAMFN